MLGIVRGLRARAVLKAVVHTTPLAVLNCNSEQGRHQTPASKRWSYRKTQGLAGEEFWRECLVCIFEPTGSLRFTFAQTCKSPAETGSLQRSRLPSFVRAERRRYNGNHAGTRRKPIRPYIRFVSFNASWGHHFEYDLEPSVAAGGNPT